MSLVSHQHKFIFVHVNRTGGTSFGTALVKGHRFVRPTTRTHYRARGTVDLTVGEKHWTLKQIQHTIPTRIFNNYFKFIFVRNPWDRVYSGYKLHLRRGNRKNLPTFNEAVISGQHGIGTQHQFFLDKDNNNLADFIGRFENLEADQEYIFNVINMKPVEIKHYNAAGDPSTSYRDVYCQETIDIVAKHCAKEIEILNYDF